MSSSASTSNLDKESLAFSCPDGYFKSKAYSHSSNDKAVSVFITGSFLFFQKFSVIYDLLIFKY